MRVFRGNKVLIGDQIKPSTVVTKDGKITEVLEGVVDELSNQFVVKK